MAKAAAAKKESANALVPWDEQLAQDAEIAAGAEANTSGGQFFSARGGILSFNDAPLPNNQMAVIQVDSIFENVFYEGEFDPSTPTAPTCFAFANEEGDLKPHPSVVEAGQAQHDTCKGCPMNEWGTADKGRGKACRNTRRLALIPAGDLTAEGVFKPHSDPEQIEKGPLGFMKLPVTSVKGYAAYVKQIAGALRRPPHGIFTKVKVVPDQKSQFKVTFEPLAKIPDKLMEAVMSRREEAKLMINQPYSLEQHEEETPARGGRASPVAKKAAKPPVKKGKKF
jgi:hypothetical protein